MSRSETSPKHAEAGNLVSMEQTPVQRHFDAEAARYDYWKTRNWYYYQTVKEMYRTHIPRDASVLEVGCGTGDVLAFIAPKRGVGIDISASMIERAKQKHPTFEWRAQTIEMFAEGTLEKFDVIFLSDVIEHLENVPSTFQALARVSKPGTTLLIGMANPLWEPLLMLLEKLHLKMPEGPHHRISGRVMDEMLDYVKFKKTKLSTRLLCPTYIPLLSPLLRLIERLPIIRSLCLIQLHEYAYRP